MKLFELEMPFKGISYLELWQPFCSAEQNHLSNFGREYYEEQFCEIILNLGKWFRRRCRLKKVYGQTDGRTTDGRQTKTDHNSSPC